MSSKRKIDIYKQRKRPSLGMLAKLTNILMLRGKQTKSETVVLNTLSYIKQKAKFDSVKLVQKAIENVEPPVATVPRIIAGRSYRLPSYIDHKRSVAGGERWIIQASRNRRERQTNTVKLGEEFISTFNRRSSAFKFRDDLVRLAKDNRPFARYGSGSKEKKRRKSF